MGWISALPWNQAPPEFRDSSDGTITRLPAAPNPECAPGPRRLLVHGREYLCVVKYSASFAGEQLHSLTTSLEPSVCSRCAVSPRS